jgi:hypothetical protein
MDVLIFFNVLLKAAHKIVMTPPSWEMLVVAAPLVSALLPLFMPLGRWLSVSIMLSPILLVLSVILAIDGIDGPQIFGIILYILTWLILFIVTIAIKFSIVGLSSAMKRRHALSKNQPVARRMR